MPKKIAIGSFEGSNNIRQYNKGIINVDANSDATEVDATRAFARTVDFTIEDIGFTTSTGGGITFDSPITSDKSDIDINVTDSQDQRSTNTDGDPTMLNNIPRSGNSAVDVIPTMTDTVRGIAKLGVGHSVVDDKIINKRYSSPIQFDSVYYDSNNPDGVSKFFTITVDGDLNTFYPVYISGNQDFNNSSLWRFCVWRHLYDRPCASYSDNHPNGGSASTLDISLRVHGWDGASSNLIVNWYVENYARMIGKLQLNTSQAAGFVIWLRGGGTKYFIWSEASLNVRGPYYSRTNISSQSGYDLFVDPLALSSATSIDTMRQGANGTFGVGYLYAINGNFSGEVRASKVYNAVWNDYAELFERGCKTEPGDLIALDTTSNTEKYILANENTFNKVVGVHSDEYGHLLGGEKPDSDIDFLQYNLPKYIPVGLCGRVRTKVIGTCKKGDYLVASNIDGVARKYNKETDDSLLVFGMACEDKTSNEIDRIKVYLK